MTGLKRIFLITAAVALSLATSAGAESMLDEKLRMEQVLSQRVSTLLDKVLGEGKSHVEIVLDVELKQFQFGNPGGKPNLKAEQEDKPEPGQTARWLWKDVARQKRITVLPGFSIAPEMTLSQEPAGPKKTPAEKSAKPAQTEPTVILGINKILVSIILDSSVSDKTSKLVQVMASEMLDLNPDRGDRLNVYTIPLIPIWKSILFPGTIGYIASLILWLVAAAVLIWLLTWAGTSILNAFGLLPAKKHKEGLLKRFLKKPAGDEDAPPAADQPGAKAKNGAADDSAKQSSPVNNPSFDFVGDDQISVLAELLADSDNDGEVACVLGFLDIRLSSRILEEFKPDKRYKTLWHLAQAKTMTPKELQDLRNTWKEKIQNAYGGAEWMGVLLSEMSTDSQNSFMSDLEHKSAETASRISKALVSFEDIFNMKAADLQLLAQSVPHKEWAVALSGLPQTYTEQIIRVLPEASLPAFKQWISLTPAQDEPVQKKAQAFIVKAARNLRQQGKISISQGARHRKSASMPSAGLV